MKKIVAFDLKSIHLHENFEFLRKVCEKGDACLPTTGDLSAADLPESTTTLLTTSLDKLQAKTNAFDAVLKIADSIPASTLAAQADAKRDKAYRDGRKFVMAMADHPNPDLASTAKTVLFLYDKYGDPTNKSQDEESSSLYNLMQDLDALEEGVLESIHFTEWYAYLKDCQDEFLAADKQRTEEKMAKETGAIKTAQTEANQAYRELVDVVNALVLVNGETPYAEFIDFVNVQIADKKAIVKSRSTKSANKKAEEKLNKSGEEAPQSVF